MELKDQSNRSSARAPQSIHTGPAPRLAHPAHRQLHHHLRDHRLLDSAALVRMPGDVKNTRAQEDCATTIGQGHASTMVTAVGHCSSCSLRIAEHGFSCPSIADVAWSEVVRGVLSRCSSILWDSIRAWPRFVVHYALRPSERRGRLRPLFFFLRPGYLLRLFSSGCSKRGL